MDFAVTDTLGYYNRIPETGWLINNKNLFIMELETGKSEISVPGWLGSGDTHSVWAAVTSQCVLTVKRDGESSLVSFNKDTDPIHEGPTLKTRKPPNTHL